MLPAASHAAETAALVVNDRTVARDRAAALVGTPVAPGRYWYDPRSGWWGKEGGPVRGAIAPGLALGGPLAASASHGKTGVFLNGRELPAAELAWLQSRLGATLPAGRYWLDADGTGGREDGPALFRFAPGPYDRESPGRSGAYSVETEWPGFRIGE